MTTELNIAIGQSPANLIGPQERLEWLEKCLKKIADYEVDLLLLPELFLCGYNIGERVAEWAEPADGPAFQRIAELARQHGLAIHYGFAERSDGQIYNAASCISAEGECLATHRKLLLPPGFEGDHFKAGKCYTVYEFKGVKIATLICYDAEFPETFRAVADAGAELVLVPTALGAQWGGVAETIIPARAFENGVYVAYANSAGREGEMKFYGGSCIIGPDGKEAARADREPEVIIARLEREEVRKAQKRLPYLIDRQALPKI